MCLAKVKTLVMMCPEWEYYEDINRFKYIEEWSKTLLACLSPSNPNSDWKMLLFSCQQFVICFNISRCSHLLCFISHLINCSPVTLYRLYNVFDLSVSNFVWTCASQGHGYINRSNLSLCSHHQTAIAINSNQHSVLFLWTLGTWVLQQKWASASVLLPAKDKTMPRVVRATLGVK